MDRADRIGLGVAVAGHLALFGLLSVGFLSTPNPEKLKQIPLEVSLVQDVALEAAAPRAVTPPAQSVAPDQGEPEDAAPPEATVAEPEPEPAQAPQPKAAPAKPEPAPPKPAPSKPAPAKPVPAPKPAPVKSLLRPAPAKAAAPAKQQPAASPAKAVAKPAASAARPAAAKSTGTKPTAVAAKPRGSRLGANFLDGLTGDPSTGTRPAPPAAARIDARAMASIVQAIARQIQPCADRQVNPGPGANQIVTTLNLRLNADGTLAATPRMVRQSGVDEDNGRYRQRVVDLGVAAFKGCSPLRLPADYYSTPSGGWNNINFQWKLQ